MDNVIDFINVNRDRYLEELKALLAIPEHQRAARARGRRDPLRRMVRRRDAPHRPAERAADRHAGQSGGLRRLAGRAGRADDSVLRPLRRAAGRSAEPVGVAAVRGDDPRRRDLRARLGRRQGPGVHALQGGRSAPETERPAAGEHQVHSRRRRGSRQRAPRRLHPRAQETSCSADVVVISDSAMFARGVPSICYGLRGLVYFQIDLRGSSTDLHSGSFGGAVANPAIRARAGARADEGSRRPHQDPRLLRRCRGAAGGGAAGVGDAAVQREAVQEGLRHPEAVRRNRLHDARADVGAADVRGQRSAVGLHRRRREDRAAGGGDGEGEHAARAESGSGQDRATCSRSTSGRSRRRPSS